MTKSANNDVYANDLCYQEQNNKCQLYRIFDRVPARLVLYFLSWSGFLVSFMMRTDINLTILAMVADPPRPKEGNVTTEYCFVAISAVKNNTIIKKDFGGTLAWSDNVQSTVLQSFYWSYIVSQIIEGQASQKWGTKRAFGYAQLVTALCSLNIPWAADIHYGIVITLRCIQGFASGITWPAMYALIGHWIPVAERSRFMSSFQGFNIGTGITYPLCGFLIVNYGWRSVFYTTGSIGAAWCIVWYLLAFDSPETHPRISLSEQRFIKANTANTFAVAKKQKVPWLAIFTSLPTWAIAITSFGRIWVMYIFLIAGPKFMKNILGFSIQANGLLNGLPYIFSYIATVFFCYIADILVTKKVMALLNVRKIMTALSQVVPGLLVLLISHLGCDVNLVVVVWFIAVIINPAAYAGAMASIVDIAPNFAGPVLAFAQTILMTSSFLAPMTAFKILDGQNLMSSWRTVFYVTAFVSISTYGVYQIWGTTKIQPWNDAPDDSKVAEQVELVSNGDKKNELDMKMFKDSCVK